MEFALVLIPFLVLTLATIQFATWFFAAQSGAAAAREAARRSAVGDLTCAALTSTAQGNSRLISSSFAVKRSYASSAGVAKTSGMAIDDNVTVTLSYDTFDFHFPFVPVPKAGKVTETAVSRVENVTASTVACP